MEVGGARFADYRHSYTVRNQAPVSLWRRCVFVLMCLFSASAAMARTPSELRRYAAIYI